MRTLVHLAPELKSCYSDRNASIGEIELARSAGINEAANADNPSVIAAAARTAGSYGFMP